MTSDVNISTATSGFFIESRLNEVREKLFNVYKKIKELEFSVMSCVLSPQEVIPETVSENKDEIITPQSKIINSIFVVSIPRELIKELNTYLDINHSLTVNERDLIDALIEQKKKQYGHNNISEFVSENVRYHGF